MSDKNWIDREGHFKVKPAEWGIKKFDSGSTALSITARILAQWNPDSQEWEDWSEYAPHYVNGWFFIIGKEGKLLDEQVERLIKATGWDGTFAVLDDPTYGLNDCIFSVQSETYNGNTRYRANWIDPIDTTPGGGGGVASHDELKDLDTKFGSQMRALGGPAPAGKPPAPD